MTKYFGFTVFTTLTKSMNKEFRGSFSLTAYLPLEEILIAKVALGNDIYFLPVLGVQVIVC